MDDTKKAAAASAGGKKTEKKPASAPAAEAAATEAAPAPEAAAEKELAAARDQLLRTMAEFDNFRKRSQKEKDALYAAAVADTAARFIPVVDSIERAAAASCTDEAYKKGVDMIIANFHSVMQALGISEIPGAGSPFDPALMNAVMHIEDETLPDNTVAEVFEKGYLLGERVLRHAMVKVAN